MKYEQRLIAAAKYAQTRADSESDSCAVIGDELGVTATLKPHQVEGVQWLIRSYRNGINVILGDEMGLGKTLQAISFLSYLKVCKMLAGPFLVLCPLSVTDGWVSEVTNFAPKLRILRYVGEKEHRRELRRKMYEHVKNHSFHSDSNVPSVPSFAFDVLLTTYDIALMDQEFLSQIPWIYAVIDEAQRLKNPSSVLYNVLNERFVIPRRLLMTGTPIQNNLTELWALMHFCMPSIFGTLEQFLSAFKEAGDTLSGQDEADNKGQFKILKYVLGAFMLRRTKFKLIESGTLVLPPLTEITVMAPMVALQKKVYVSILRKELPTLLASSSGASNHQSLQNIVIQLRKACSHPYLFPGIEPEPYEEGEHLVEASGKLIILDQLLKKLHDSGHRVLLFAQMTHTLDVLQDFLELRKYSYERLDGSIRAEERFAAIRSFSQPSVKKSVDSKLVETGAFVFMISTRAGGVGLNLVAADTVIFYEQDWNPQVDKQALQRAHRIGQFNHVLSINLVTGRSIEEVIMRRAEKKLQLSDNVIGEGVDQEQKETVGAEAGDLRSVIFGLHMFDPTEITNEKSDELNISNLNALTDKVTGLRFANKSDEGAKFEANPMDQERDVLKKNPASAAYPDFEEASYLSWVEKFKEASHATDSLILEAGNRKNLPDQKHERAEAAKKVAEAKKLAKWEALGYHSLSVEDTDQPRVDDLISDSGAVHFVYGDCTQPSTVCPSEPAIVFSCVDDSGNWGHGGMFTALEKVSPSIPSAYERAAEFKDLHLGDLHLIEIKEDRDDQSDEASLWVALAVVQSYNPRRKIPRSSISFPDLERCISKASFSAAQKSASIHMPRIGYQDGSDRSEWYTVERLLRKYAALYGIQIFVYYYRPSS